jgi:hypothetical protein
MYTFLGRAICGLGACKRYCRILCDSQRLGCTQPTFIVVCYHRVSFCICWLSSKIMCMQHPTLCCSMHESCLSAHPEPNWLPGDCLLYIAVQIMAIFEVAVTMCHYACCCQQTTGCEPLLRLLWKHAACFPLCWSTPVRLQHTVRLFLSDRSGYNIGTNRLHLLSAHVCDRSCENPLFMILFCATSLDPPAATCLCVGASAIGT